MKGNAVLIKDRIKELRRVKASELLPNPKNWRTHPEHQKNALKAVLAEVGYADAVLAYETPKGLMLVDGHLRAETTPDNLVPVLILDITDEEADKILLTMDPLSALAIADPSQLSQLLENVQIQSDSIQTMLDGLAAQAGLVVDGWDGEKPQAIGDIKDYDPDNETVSIRLNNVPAPMKDDVVKVMDEAAAKFGFKCEVF